MGCWILQGLLDFPGMLDRHGKWESSGRLLEKVSRARNRPEGARSRPVEGKAATPPGPRNLLFSR